LFTTSDKLLKSTVTHLTSVNLHF